MHSVAGTLQPRAAPRPLGSWRPRAAPSYSPSLSEAFTPFEGKHLVNSLTAGSYCVTRLYYVEERDIAMLRARASGEGVGERRATRLEAMSAYLWKALAAVVAASGSDETCRMGWWVNGRRRRITVPEETRRNYVGYVTAFAVADASTDAIQRRPLPEIASMMRESIRSTTTDEHFQELLDWVCHMATDMWVPHIITVPHIIMPSVLVDIN